MRKNTNINLKGFTIIELLVSISVLALISGIFLANYHSANRQSALNLAARQLASDIRLAQSYTMGLREFSGTVPAGGWGMEFLNLRNYYEMFADQNSDQTYTSGSAELYKKIYLPQGVETGKIYCSTDSAVPAVCSGSGFAEGYVLFIPPNPDILIKEGVTNICSSACMAIYDKITNKEKHIKVNHLGLVSID